MAIHVDFTADIEKLNSAMGKLEEKNLKLEKQLKAMKNESQATAKGVESIGGDKVLSGIMKATTAIFSMQSAMSLVRKVFAQYMDEIRSAKQELEQSRRPSLELAQLAGGDPREYQRLLGVSRRILEAPGSQISSAEQASRLTYGLQTAGLTDKAELFAQLAGIVDVEQVVKAAGVTAKAFEGRGGDVEGVISKAIHAAAPLPQAGPVEVVKGLAGVGGTASLLGYSADEMLSALTILSKKTESVDEAATKLSALMSAAMQQPDISQQIVGKDFSTLVRVIAGQDVRTAGIYSGDNLDEVKAAIDRGERTSQLELHELTQFLGGRKEAREAFGLFTAEPVAGGKSPAEEYREMLSQLGGITTETTRRMIDLPRSVPHLEALRQEQQTTALQNIAREEAAVATTEMQTASRARAQEIEAGGIHPMLAGFQRIVDKAIITSTTLLRPGEAPTEVRGGGRYSPFENISTAVGRDFGDLLDLTLEPFIGGAGGRFRGTDLPQLQAAADKMNQAADKFLDAAMTPRATTPTTDPTASRGTPVPLYNPIPATGGGM